MPSGDWTSEEPSLLTRYYRQKRSRGLSENDQKPMNCVREGHRRASESPLATTIGYILPRERLGQILNLPESEPELIATSFPKFVA